MATRNSPQFLPASGVYFPGAYASMVSALSVPEKQKILYRAAQGLDGGQEALESWTRKDLLQLICLEMGKERKYTGVSKGKMIEHLMKLVARKGIGDADGTGNMEGGISDVSPESLVRKQRKVGRPARVPPTPATDMDGRKISQPSPLLSPSPPTSPPPSIAIDTALQVLEPSLTVCRNTACKAQLLLSESFCVRCSCFICRSFDDNKDPSLWIVCTPEPNDSGMDCRLSCHIECALKDGIAGVAVVASEGAKFVLDASFRCPSCGKHSSLIGCCRKQLLVARDARRVDSLCQRLSLCRRLLMGTHKHKEFHELIEKAIQKLEDEIGPVMEGSSKFVRGLVNRLSSSGEVLQLISRALEKSDVVHDVVESENRASIAPSIIQENRSDLLCTIEFNKVLSSSISLSVRGGGELATGYRLWHRRAAEASFPNNPTCIISSNPGEAQILDLQPNTVYHFYIVPFSERGIGEPAEASCHTKSTEQELLHMNSTEGQPQMDIEEGRIIIDKLGTDFKVRNLGKMFYEHGSNPFETTEGTFNGGKRGIKTSNDHKKNEEIKSDCVSSGVNIFSSPQGNVSNVNRQGTGNKTFISCDLNVSADLAPSVEEHTLTSDVKTHPRPSRTTSTRYSTGLLQTKGAEDDISEPGNSQISQREETEAVSGIVSHALQTNTTNEADEDAMRTTCQNSHGESWAMQVRQVRMGMDLEPQPGVLQKRTPEGCNADGFRLVNAGTGGVVGRPLCASRNYEFCVKIVRWLECEGHLTEDFRMKFLTWFSLRASEHEKRVVGVFIDTLQDDPSSLASQLVDTFSEAICSKRHQMASNGFGNKQWH